MLTESNANLLGSAPADFNLLGVDEKHHQLADFSGAPALVVMFICNHCPYVIAIQDRLNELAKRFGSQGVRFVAINANDSDNYPEDNFEAMQVRSKEKGYVFPYLWDETQEVAKAYDAACTPDLYVYGQGGEGYQLRYHGRLDDSWQDASQVTRHELAEALEAILDGRSVTEDQKPSMGCNIKWK